MKQRGKKKRKPPRKEREISPVHHQTTEAPTRFVSAEQIIHFEREGHITIPKLLNAKHIETTRKAAEEIIKNREIEALRHRVRVLCPSINSTKLKSKQEALDLLHDYGVEPVGFLQFFNSWKTHQAITDLVNSPILVQAAQDLLGCEQVRLYQDCIFLKRAGMYGTNWHSDVRLTPLDTNDFLSFWIPLRPLEAKNDSGLQFAQRSHKDMAAFFWRDPGKFNFDKRKYKLQSTGAMAVGDVSVHHGWTLHNAPHQPEGSKDRTAISVCFFRDGARVLDWEKEKTLRKELVDAEDYESYQSWEKGLNRRYAKHKDLPLGGQAEVRTGPGRNGAGGNSAGANGAAAEGKKEGRRRGTGSNEKGLGKDGDGWNVLNDM